MVGGTLTGPLKVNQAGSAWSLASTDNSLQVGGQAGAPVNMILDGYRIQTRDGAGGAWPLEINNLGGPVRIGTDTVSAQLVLRGVSPLGGQFLLGQSGVTVMEAIPYGADLLLTKRTTPGTFRIQSFDTVSIWPNATVSPATYKAAEFQGAAIQSGNEPLRLNSQNAIWNYLAFYNTAGVRRAFMGINAEIDTVLSCDAGDLIFRHGSVHEHRITPVGHFCMGSGMTTPSIANEGGFFNVTNSAWTLTNALLNQPLVLTNKIGAGNAGGSDVCHFRMVNTTRGSITHPTTTTTAFNTSSDYRLKDVLGPVDSPLEQLALLKPWHVRWKENGEEQDTFIAHEVAEVVSVAVTGKKDAVTGPPADEGDPPEGEIIPQQLDASKLIPLLTAALQEAVERIERLEAAAA